MTPGPLIIVSGPSGSGKSTLIRLALARSPRPLRLAVSATTRPPRPGEVDGVDYHFWTPEHFQAQVDAGAFLECAQVHGRNWYGTPRAEVLGHRERGVGVVLDIDVQGAAQIRPLFPDHLSVFVRLPALGDYEARLRRRGSETDESIARRMETTRRELAHLGEYQHVLVNDTLPEAVDRLLELIERHQARRGEPAA